MIDERENPDQPEGAAPDEVTEDATEEDDEHSDAPGPHGTGRIYEEDE